jgi:hypothetical protein
MPPDDPNTNTPTGGEPAAGGQPTGTPPSGGEPKLFTQEEVNRLVGQARVDARRSAQQAPKPAEPEGPVTLKQLQSQIEEGNLRRSFDRLAIRAGLEDEAADDLFDLYRTQRPENLHEWFGKKVKAFGLKSGTPAEPETSTASGAPAAPGANPKPEEKPATPKSPAAAPTAPNAVNPLLSGELVDVTKLTGAQLAELGPVKVRELFDKQRGEAAAAAGNPLLPKALRGKN